MDRLFFFLGDIQHTKLGGADSFTDQLSCKYTVFLLSLFAVLSTTRVYISDPISCFCPANFPGSQVDYTDKFCWSTNTHYLPFEKEHLPKDHEPKNVISYYQWVPLFLAFQALLFYLPRPIWRTLSRKSGITLSNITDAAIECQRKAEQEGAEKTMKYMTRYMNRFLQKVHHSRITRRQPIVVSRLRQAYYENYLTVTYIFVKILYAVNVIGQLFFLNCFLGTNDYHLYGVDVLRRMAAGEDWTTSARFPRVTICDFHIRTLGNVHRHTVQCALPMNLYNEMMFIFFWFWFVFVAVATVASLVNWIVQTVLLPLQVTYVKNRLVATGKIRPTHRRRYGGAGCGLKSGNNALSGVDSLRPGETPPDDDIEDELADVPQFVYKYLFRDGCFIIRLVAKNATDLIAAELIAGIYEQYAKCRARDGELTDRNDNNPPAGGISVLPSAPYGTATFPSKTDLLSVGSGHPT